jgi:hypothetical protein
VFVGCSTPKFRAGNEAGMNSLYRAGHPPRLARWCTPRRAATSRKRSRLAATKGEDFRKFSQAILDPFLAVDRSFAE